MRRDLLDRDLILGWAGIAKAAGFTINGAKHAASIGSLPVTYLDGIPAANPSLLRVNREREGRKARQAAREGQRAALAETIEA